MEIVVVLLVIVLIVLKKYINRILMRKIAVIRVVGIMAFISQVLLLFAPFGIMHSMISYTNYTEKHPSNWIGADGGGLIIFILLIGVIIFQFYKLVIRTGELYDEVGFFVISPFIFSLLFILLFGHNK